MNTIIIHIIGNPGSGKSKTATSLFTLLKKAGLLVSCADGDSVVEPFEAGPVEYSDVRDAIANLNDLRFDTDFRIITITRKRKDG